jgi:hypothetical protein
MAILLDEEIKADCARFRSLGPDPMTDRLFGVLWDQAFQIRLGLLMIEKGGAGGAKETGRLSPGVR